MKCFDIPRVFNGLMLCAVSVLTASASEIRVDAVDYDTSFGAIKMPVGEGFASAHSVILNGGAEYALEIPVTADYALSALLTGSDKRPVDIIVDDKPVRVGFDNKTGDWDTISAEWFDQGVIALTAGRHRLSFKPKGSMPHFCAFKLSTPTAFPRPSFPTTASPSDAVEPAWQTLAQLLTQRAAWKPFRTTNAYAEAKKVLVGQGNAGEQRALITLLAMGNSPFTMGARPASPELLSNREVMEVHQRGYLGRQLLKKGGVVVWVSDAPGRPDADPLDLRRDKYVAVFGTDGSSSSVTVKLADLCLTGSCTVRDCWSGKELPQASGEVALPVLERDAGLYRINFTARPKNHLMQRGELLAAAEKILYKKTAQEDLYCHLLRPMGDAKKPRPAILYFSGGGWNANNVTWVIQECAWFRDHGIIGIACDYRVAGRHKTDIPAAVQDAKSAVRYIRTHAKELGIDPQRIIVAGGSAGGHIAACTAMPGHDELGEDLSVSSRADALVLGNPVVGKGFNEGFFDKNPDMSPLEGAKSKGWPPVILINGTADTITPQAGAELFTRRMKAAGNVCELITIEGGGHGATWPTSSPHFEPAYTRVVAFLRENRIIPQE